MGYESRANPRSPDSDATADERALAMLIPVLQQIPSAIVYERWLLTFPAHAREQVRHITQKYCTFTVEALRAARQAQEADTERLKARALRLAEAAHGGEPHGVKLENG